MLFDRKTYVVKERVGLVKLVDTYDLLDAQTGQSIGIAKEEPPEWAKWLRLVVNRQFLPTAINVYEREGAAPIVSIQRGFTFFRARVNVVANGKPIGYFVSKLLSIGPSFRIFTHLDQEIGLVKGDWKGWNFQMQNEMGQELGRVTKKWAGMAKELFTSADTYVIALSDSTRPEVAPLLLAAGLAIDTVYKEKQ